MALSHEDFMRMFDEWAPTYDQTVHSPHAEGFENYAEVLRRVVAAVSAQPGDLIIDVGAGTGNLSAAVREAGYRVVAIEPSRGMRMVARSKLPDTPVLDGHFLAVPQPDRSAAAVVSSYAFHHLDDATKRQAARELARVVRPGGRIVIADIAFASAGARQEFRAELAAAGKWELVEELDTEYYTSIDVLADAFRSAGCRVEFEQLDPWVWLLTATKQ